MKKCTIEDSDRIFNFYRFVTDGTEHMSNYCRWIYGLHPSDEMITEYIKEGAMYYWEKDGDIVAAAAVIPYQPADYHDASWQIKLEDDEVSSVHILGVDPRFQNQGIATSAMRDVIEHAKATGKKAVRLDVIEGNTPAFKLYESLGFHMCDVQNWYVANLGYTNFYPYEYVL